MLTGIILHKVKQPPRISTSLNIGEHYVIKNFFYVQDE